MKDGPDPSGRRQQRARSRSAARHRNDRRLGCAQRRSRNTTLVGRTLLLRPDRRLLIGGGYSSHREGGDLTRRPPFSFATRLRDRPDVQDWTITDDASVLYPHRTFDRDRHSIQPAQPLAKPTISSAASFLDARLLERRPPTTWTTDWREPFHRRRGAWLRSAPTSSSTPAMCGSTLLSRLLGEHRATVQPCESRRSFARSRPGELRDRLAPLLALFSRTWRPGPDGADQGYQLRLRDRHRSPAWRKPRRADSVDPAIHNAAGLPAHHSGGAEGSRHEAAAAGAASGQARLAMRLASVRRSHAEGDGERIAMPRGSVRRCRPACAGKSRSRRSLRSGSTSTACWLEPGVHDCAWRITPPPASGPEDARHPRAVLAGPLMRRYAKAPEHPYDADLRRQPAGAGRTRDRPKRSAAAWTGSSARSTVDASAARRRPAGAPRSRAARASLEPAPRGL